MIKAIIFDLDGVLIDSENLHYKAWEMLVKELGGGLTKEEFRENYFGKSPQDIIALLVKRKKFKIADSKLAEFEERRHGYYRIMAKDLLQATKGARQLLEKLKVHSYKIALATGTTPGNIEAANKKTGFDLYFNAVVNGTEVKKGKPNPDLFLKAADKLGIKPENCVVVEDTPVGIEAAKRARMKCIAITTTHSREELKGADKIIDSFDELTMEDIKSL